MAKLVLPTISGGYASVTQLNTAFDQIETELQNKVLYRNNPTGEPNQLESDIDMNGHRLLNQLATNGNENFAWRGVWTTGTSYSVNNLVYAPEGTNEGATLICITAHTAGTTLDGDSAYWTVLAARGASGAGTGDVIGPASSTDNSLARFSGITGKLLKDGAVIGTDVQAHSANLDTLSSLTTGTSSGNIPLIGSDISVVQAGAVMYFAMSTPPTGWLKADGTAVSRTTYFELFSAISTTFGVGDGTTTFNLPDLRGEFLRGFDDGRGVDSARVFGSSQADDFKSHSHNLGVASIGSQGADGSSGWSRPTSAWSASAKGGTETRPRNVAMLACIKY